MAITKIQAGALPADVITTAAIDDASITHAKLHTTMDLSSKTVTLPTLSTLNTTGSVGIGTSAIGGSSTTKLHLMSATTSSPTVANDADELIIEGTGHSGMTFLSTSSSNIRFGDAADSSVGQITYDHSTNSLYFGTDNTERMRISSLGTVLVGKTSEGTDTDGIELNRNDVIVATRNNDAPLILNRRTSDGDITVFRKDNAAVGSISSNSAGGVPVLDINTHPSSGIMRMLTSGTERMRITSTGNVGIGTQSPVSLSSQTSLTINGTSVGRLDLQGTGQLYANGTEIVLQGSYGKPVAIDAGTNQHISFRYATAEKMRIDSSGNLIVGNAGVSFTSDRLQVKSPVGEPVASFYRPRNTAGGGLVRFMSDVGGTQTIVAQVTSEGKFHGKLGTTTAAMVRATQTSASASALVSSNNGSILWSIKSASDSSWYSISGDRFTILKSGLVSLNVNQDIITTNNSSYAQCRISVNGSIQAYQLITNTNGQWNAIANHWNGYLNVNDYIQLSFQAADITAIDHGNWSNYDFMWIAQ